MSAEEEQRQWYQCSSVTDPYIFETEDERVLVGFLAEVPEALVGGEDLGLCFDEESHGFLDANNDQVDSNGKEHTGIYNSNSNNNNNNINNNNNNNNNNIKIIIIITITNKNNNNKNNNNKIITITITTIIIINKTFA